jgi:hypothetical protein
MRRVYIITIPVLALVLSLHSVANGQSKDELRQGLKKGWTQDQVEAWEDYINEVASQNFQSVQQEDCEDFTFRRDALLNGNKITTQITNFGSISAPGNRITDIVWNGLGYGYEFGPLVAAEIVDENREDPQSVPKRDANGNVVTDANGDTVYVMHIVSDGLVSNGGEQSPDNAQWWGWQPIPCAQPVGGFEGIQVVDPISTKIPTSDDLDRNLDGKPDSWPDSWFNENLGDYVWPGALRQGASNADKEALYFMNDYQNLEFAYLPFEDRPDSKGLGLEVEVRLYQWVNPLAEDAIFLVYKITNKSGKDLDKVIFGMWGDPHVGGPSNWQDDLAFFDRDLNMVFAWDDDGLSDVSGRPPGYFGYKFLESPGIGNEIINGVAFPGDGIDNDGDGVVDESWTDGIDNDGDWDPEKHDVGIDGISGTADEGEGDGVPTAGDLFDITKPGEPNFEFTDIDESDQIGLTSFASPPFAGNRVSNDERVWEMIQPGRFDDVPEIPGDYVFLYGSGSFKMRAGETKRFSIALIVGENRDDLILNAETVQEIYDAGYVFATAPEKPIVTAVPGDEKVTLYWDDRAEDSVDPLTERNDFEGYVIYRSVDHDFADQQTITDINGSAFLYRPLSSVLGVDARFDRINGLRGPAEVPYPRRGVSYDLGDDTGLFHSFVDSNNVVNGQRYFYTVVAYDHGAPDLGIPPSETSKIITYDPQLDDHTFDVNTVEAIPAPAVAGYVRPALADEEGIVQVSGHGTGEIQLEVLNELAVEDQNLFRLEFLREGTDLSYSLYDLKPVVDSLVFATGKNSKLSKTHVNDDGFVLRGESGQTYTRDVDYSLDAERGVVLPLPGGAIGDGTSASATYTFAAVSESRNVNLEESNPVFDGLKILVQDVPLQVDTNQTGWVGDPLALESIVREATAGPGRMAQPADYEVRFEDEPVDTSVSSEIPLPFRVYNLTKSNQQLQVFVPDINRNGEWDIDETVIFLEDLDGSLTATWELQLSDPDATGAFPGAGDIYFVRTDKPFTSNDVFEFTTTAATTSEELVREQLDDIYVVPNPYVATNQLEPRNPVSNVERGDRRLYFANLPKQCTIRIYTINGELVETLEHDSTLDDGKEFWDLKTKDNMNIAYGLYLFHVESPEGEFIGKFAVIK